MKIVSLTCPKCGGNLDEVKIADGKNDTYCSFCGNHIYLDNENYKVVEHRTVDAVKMKELEYRLRREEEEYQRKEKRRLEDLAVAEKRKKIGGEMFIFGILIFFGSAFLASLLTSMFKGMNDEILRNIGVVGGFIWLIGGSIWLYYRSVYNKLR